MKALALVLMIIPSLVRAVPRTATLEERAEIMEAIAKGLADREAFKAAKEEEAELRDIANKLSETDEAYFEALRQWKKAEEQMQDKEQQMHRHLDRAIELTEKSYNLEPPADAQIIANGPLKGMEARWSPTFYADDDGSFHPPLCLRQATGPDGRDHHLKFKGPSDTSGETGPDGQVMIRLEAFERVLKDGHPGQLAYALHHEAVHFNRLVEGGWKSVEEEELAAYSKSLEFASKFQFDGGQARFLADKKAEFAGRVRRGKLGGGQLTGSLTNPFLEVDEEETKEEFMAHREQMAGINQQRQDLKRQMEESRRESIRREREAARGGESGNPVGASGPPLPGSAPGAVRAEIPGPSQAAGPFGPSYADALADLAQRACAVPGSISQGGLDSRFAWYPRPIVREVGQDGRQLTGCAKEFYLLLLKWNDEPGTGRLTEPWLTEISRSIAAKYASAPGTSAPDPASPSPEPSLPDAPVERDECFQGGEFRWCPKK